MVVQHVISVNRVKSLLDRVAKNLHRGAYACLGRSCLSVLLDLLVIRLPVRAQVHEPVRDGTGRLTKRCAPRAPHHRPARDKSTPHATRTMLESTLFAGRTLLRVCDALGRCAERKSCHTTLHPVLCDSGCGWGWAERVTGVSCARLSGMAVFTDRLCSPAAPRDAQVIFFDAWRRTISVGVFYGWRTRGPIILFHVRWSPCLAN